MHFMLRLVVPLALLTACAGASERANGPAGGPMGALANSEWQFTEIDGAAPVADGAKLTFRRRELGATAGCNAMGGDWRIEGGRLIAGPLVQTEMYCEGPVWAQERALSALLTAAPKIDVEGGRMELRSGGHSAELRKVR